MRIQRSPKEKSFGLQLVDKVGFKILLSSFLTKDEILESLPPGGRCRACEAEGAWRTNKIFEKVLFAYNFDL